MFVDGELWRARRADGRDLVPGEHVRVEAVDGLELTVRVGFSSMAAGLVALVVVLFLVVLFLISAIKVAREYERGIVFRLGRLLPEPKGPGLFLLIPIVDRMVKVDLRTITLNIPPQEVITKDNVPVRVNAVAYFRIVAPKDAIVQVENFMVATSQIAQTTLRSVLGQHVLDELLSEREKINAILQEIIDEATAPWGIKVSIVEVKDVEIPQSMQRAMARQAEAERERRAKVINAEGEFQASERLKDAALVIEEHPIALQLRYLQTLLELGAAQGVDDRLPGADRPDQAVPRGPRWQLDLRADPLSGRLVVVAPNRRRRPGAAAGLIEEPTEAELDECPFCAGREDRTPPETYRVGDRGGLDGARRAEPLSRVRAAGGRRALAAARAHVRRARPTTRSPRSRRRGRRARRARAKASATCTRCINEGAAAGSSLAALALAARLAPTSRRPRSRAKTRRARRARCDELVVAERDGMRAAVHRAGRLPYETLIAGEPFELEAALFLLRDVDRAAARGRGPGAVERVAPRAAPRARAAAERPRRRRARRRDLREHGRARGRGGRAASAG